MWHPNWIVSNRTHCCSLTTFSFQNIFILRPRRSLSSLQFLMSVACVRLPTASMLLRMPVLPRSCFPCPDVRILLLIFAPTAHTQTKGSVRGYGCAAKSGQLRCASIFACTLPELGTHYFRQYTPRLILHFMIANGTEFRFPGTIGVAQRPQKHSTRLCL